MIAVVQRVKSCDVAIDGNITSGIKSGLLVLLGIQNGDNQDDIKYISNKILKLRIFNDDQDHMNFSVGDVDGEIMVVSQFTLLANTKKGHRPSYINAAKPEISKYLYRLFCEKLKNYEINVKKGRFGAHMELDLINDGPVTILLGYDV